MEKLIKAGQIAWNPFSAVKIRMEEGKLRIEEVVVPFLTVIVTCKLIEFEALRYYFEALFYAIGQPAPDFPPLMSNKFAQEFLAAFGAFFPTGAIFLLPKSFCYPQKASSIEAVVLIITSSFTFYGSAIASTLYILIGTVIQINPSMAQSLIWLPTIAALAIIPIAIWFWCRILLSVLGLSKFVFSSITVSYILGIVILVMIIGLGSDPLNSGFFSRERGKFPGAIFNMLCIHK
ncbi:MAG: hypothetical protein ACN4GM_09000 [Gammaproteobacteria bacterium]